MAHLCGCCGYTFITQEALYEVNIFDIESREHKGDRFLNIYYRASIKKKFIADYMLYYRYAEMLFL